MMYDTVCFCPGVRLTAKNLGLSHLRLFVALILVFSRREVLTIKFFFTYILRTQATDFFLLMSQWFATCSCVRTERWMSGSSRNSAGLPTFLKANEYSLF
jgi:hypothetical protein